MPTTGMTDQNGMTLLDLSEMALGHFSLNLKLEHHIQLKQLQYLSESAACVSKRDVIGGLENF